MVSRLGLVVAIGLLLGGCSATSNCAGWKQINPSRKDVLSQGTFDQILSHNLFGRAQGCWTSRSR